MKKIILITVILVTVGHAETRNWLNEGISMGIALSNAKRSALQEAQQARYQHEMIVIQRENLRQQRLLNEAKIREINARTQQVRVRESKRSILKYKNNSSKYFTTEKGTHFRVVYNKHGAILKSKSFTIYLGNSCDTTSPEFGIGTWKDGRHMGFSIQFNNKKIVFPMQQILIKNNAKCI